MQDLLERRKINSSDIRSGSIDCIEDVVQVLGNPVRMFRFHNGTVSSSTPLSESLRQALR
jgi:hypothetical protein